MPPDRSWPAAASSSARPARASRSATPDDVVGRASALRALDAVYLTSFQHLLRRPDLPRRSASNDHRRRLLRPTARRRRRRRTASRVVFTDVDLPNTSKVEAFDVTGKLIGVSFAPVTATTASRSPRSSPTGRPDRPRAHHQRQRRARPPASWTARRPTSSRWTTSSSARRSRPPTSRSPSRTRPIPWPPARTSIYTATVVERRRRAPLRPSKLHWQLPAGVAARLRHAEPGHLRDRSTSCDLGAIAAGATATVTVDRPGRRAAGSITGARSGRRAPTT